VREQPDAVDVLIHEHRHIEELFAAYEASSEPADQTKVAHAVVHDLAVHGEIEELLFYPRIRAVLPDGDALADEAVHEHLEIKRTLNDIDRMRAEDDGFDRKMRELIAEVRHHVEEEESELFPRIRDAVDRDDLVALAGHLAAARAMVPTRPHPNAPTQPLAKVAISPPVVLVDRVRDAIRGWADKRG
jgi:hemerythrin superfamily protein